MAQKAIELLNQSEDDTDLRSSILAWLQTLGILFSSAEESVLPGWGPHYKITQEQFRHIAEVTIPYHPDWFPDLAHPLQYAAPGLFVAFLADNGRYHLTTVVEVKGTEGTPVLLSIGGVGKGWYNLEGRRTTKEGTAFQGSAYAGQISPVDSALLATIERQQLLLEIMGYHKQRFGEDGTIHAASTSTLRTIRDILADVEHEDKAV